MTELDTLVAEVSARHKVDPLLVHAVIRVESNYNQFALSYRGAQGFMQLIPATARILGVQNAFDMHQNIDGGIRYLKAMMDRFGNLTHAVAAYNAGPEAVARYGGVPPYPETQNYVYMVGREYLDLQKTHPPAPAVEVAEQRPPEAEFRPIESYVDAEGRLHLQTK
jgi:soluble lytic murein transglycosylase-like protein